MKSYLGELTERKGKLLGWVIGMIVFFVVSIIMSAVTGYEFVVLISGISVLVAMWLLHRQNVKEDEVRGICKGINKVASIRWSGVLLCFVGIHLANSSWENPLVSSPLYWVWVLFAVFFIVRGIICIRSGNEYDNTIKRLDICEAKLKYLGYGLDKWNDIQNLTPNKSNETNRE